MCACSSSAMDDPTEANGHISPSPTVDFGEAPSQEVCILGVIVVVLCSIDVCIIENLNLSCNNCIDAIFPCIINTRVPVSYPSLSMRTDYATLHRQPRIQSCAGGWKLAYVEKIGRGEKVKSGVVVIKMTTKFDNLIMGFFPWSTLIDADNVCWACGSAEYWRRSSWSP